MIPEAWGGKKSRGLSGKMCTYVLRKKQLGADKITLEFDIHKNGCMGATRLDVPWYGNPKVRLDQLGILHIVVN